MILQGGEVVIADGEGVIAIYPYRDSKRAKITESARNALLVFCGAPGVGHGRLREARSIATILITTFCGGKIAASEEYVIV